jgi:NitT/TauT family transport system substrate-binding protein
MTTDGQLTRRQALAITAAAAAAAAITMPSLVRAQTTPIKIGYTGVADYASAFIAQEEGFFAKRGLQTELQLIQLNSTLPAALVSNSIQIGGPTPSVMLQAVDNGLDLVAVAGCAAITRELTTFGVTARAGVPIAKAEDFVGKRVGVPGLNAFLHVLFRKWLMTQGVDPRRVTYVEVAFPQMPDILRGGTVDAVVTGEPVLGRIVSGNIGTLVSNMTPDIAEPLFTSLWSSTREWATRNGPAVAAFKAAVVEAGAFAKAEPEKTRAHIAKYTRLPPEIVARVPLPNLKAEVTRADIEMWVKVMGEQDMLQGKIDAARVVL